MQIPHNHKRLKMKPPCTIRAMQASKSFNHASRRQPFLIRSILHRLPAGTASQRGQPPASDRSWPCARVVRRAKLPPSLTACHMAERIRGPVVLEVLRNFRPREAIPRTSLMTVSHNLDTILEKLYLKQDNRQRAFRTKRSRVSGTIRMRYQRCAVGIER